MRRVLLFLLAALTSCDNRPSPDTQPSALTGVVDANPHELDGLIRLESLDAALSWSSANDHRFVVYASPWSEGIMWEMPGLRCPSETFASATKVEIGVTFPESATLARALAVHNQRLASKRGKAGTCAAFAVEY